MTSHDHIAGALALPIVVVLAFVEPALGLVGGFAVFAAAHKALPLLQRARPLEQPLPAHDAQQKLAA
jgi:hypothetical protein